MEVTPDYLLAFHKVLQGRISPLPKTKLQKVRPFSLGPAPTRGRAARPEPRKKASSPVISTNNAAHSRRSNLCRALPGAPTIRSTSEISALLVDIADEKNIAPNKI